MSQRLSFAGKIRRLRGRLKDAEWRRYGGLLLTGKFTAIALLLLVALLLRPDLMGLASHAQAPAPPPPTLKGNDIVNPVNTAWTLVAAFLVFGMQVGFTMLEAGFCRSRETVNVLMECIVDTCLCGILFYAWGFAFMFEPGETYTSPRMACFPAPDSFTASVNFSRSAAVLRSAGDFTFAADAMAARSSKVAESVRPTNVCSTRSNCRQRSNLPERRSRSCRTTAAPSSRGELASGSPRTGGPALSRPVAPPARDAPPRSACAAPHRSGPPGREAARVWVAISGWSARGALCCSPPLRRSTPNSF